MALWESYRKAVVYFGRKAGLDRSPPSVPCTVLEAGESPGARRTAASQLCLTELATWMGTLLLCVIQYGRRPEPEPNPAY